MNKVMLMGRLTRDPEVRYTQSSTPTAIGRYTLAVNRRFKREGEQEVDFINCVAFGKAGEFVEKYLKKGQLIVVFGRLQISQYNDKDGNKRYSTDVVVEEHYFAESKNTSSNKNVSNSSQGFYPIDETLEDEDLPF